MFAASAGAPSCEQAPGLHIDKAHVVTYGGLLGDVWLNKELWPEIAFSFFRLTDRKLGEKMASLADRLENLRGPTGLGYLVCAPLGRSCRPKGRWNCSRDERLRDRWFWIR